MKGSAIRAEGNETLRTVCAGCGKSIPTEVGHAHPLDEDVKQETWGLLGRYAGHLKIFPACAACHAAGWRPPYFGEGMAGSRPAERAPHRPHKPMDSLLGEKRQNYAVR